MKKALILAAAVAVVAATAPAHARDQIRAVGSSTVFPFTTAVAEQFGRAPGMRTPIVESTGTGGGFRLFCAGIGDAHPDIANASRPITASEKASCKQNGVTDIVEVKIGFDGIVFANARNAPAIKITIPQLWMALAREVPDATGKLIPNPAKNWSDIDRALPAKKIEVMGPPPTSGTRDAWVELVMAPGCAANTAMRALQATDTARYTAACAAIREDGGYVEAGENDILIVRKLEANADAFGIFGYSFLAENEDKIKGNEIGGVKPTYESIAGNKYPVSRPLYFYAKKQHIPAVAPGLAEFIRAFTDDKAWGPDGYLTDHGLIALPDAERRKVQAESRALNAIAM